MNLQPSAAAFDAPVANVGFDKLFEIRFAGLQLGPNFCAIKRDANPTALRKSVNRSAIFWVAGALVWLAAICGSVSAQSPMPPLGDTSRPVWGGTGASHQLESPAFGASRGTDALRHRSASGKPCIVVSGYAQPHGVNPNLYDHVVTVINSCADRVDLKICYYNSLDCISVEVAGNERKEAILGIMPSLKDFRFEFREKF